MFVKDLRYYGVSLDCRKFEAKSLSLRHLPNYGMTLILSDYKWRTLFLIGRTPDAAHPAMLADEMRVHNDLLLFDTGESFYNLTEKLQKSMQWISKQCDFKYLLKCDDDIFVNVAKYVFHTI